jgi:hypothetical protein
MSQSDNVISLYDHNDNLAFSVAETKILRALIQYALIESLQNFNEHQREYPFITRKSLYPSHSAHTREWQYQHPAFVILYDGVLPRAQNKNFRLRSSNLLSWRNLLKVLPETELEDFRAADCNVDSDEFSALLNKVLSLDFALLVQSEQDKESLKSSLRLTHMHVKVERLTDIALKELGKELGYIDRSLFERGEDYVEAFEAKFFEYFGFSAHASGRKSAAAMATQLLMKTGQDFTVFAASQSDLRLTLLRKQHVIEQYFLIALTNAECETLCELAEIDPEVGLIPYQVELLESGERVFIYCAEFSRTAAALPGRQRVKEKGLQESWLDFATGRIIAPDFVSPALNYDWADVKTELNPAD